MIIETTDNRLFLVVDFVVAVMAMVTMTVAMLLVPVCNYNRSSRDRRFERDGRLHWPCNHRQLWEKECR